MPTFEYQIQEKEYADGGLVPVWSSIGDRYGTRLEAERAARRNYGGKAPWRVVEVAA